MRQGAIIGPIIVAIGLIVAAIIFAVVGAVLQTADGGTELRLDRAESEIETLADEVNALREELNAAQSDLKRQGEEVALLAGQTRPEPVGATVQAELPTPELDAGEEKYFCRVSISFRPI